MPRFTRETEEYFRKIEGEFRKVEEAKKRNNSELDKPKPINLPEISEEMEIGALPVKKPPKKKESNPSS